MKGPISADGSIDGNVNAEDDEPRTAATAAHPARRRTKGNGFVAATVSFVAVFAAGASAIPLYGTYRAVDGVTDAEFSLVAVGYFVCAVTGLLVLGRLSNHVGRRPVAIAALILGAGGCLVLLVVHSFLPLLIGRGLQGLAAGLASSAIAAYAVDTAPREPAWLIATVTSVATNIGLSIGVFASGALVQFAPAPRQLTFLVFAGVLLACAIAIATRPESVSRKPGAARSLVPQVRVPAGARPFLFVATCVFVSTWALGGYFQAFGASVAGEYLGSESPLAAAAVFASYMAPSFLGGPIAGRLRSATAQRIGMALVASGAAGLAFATAAGSAALFLGCAVVASIGMGMGMSGSMGALLPHAAPSERAGLLAAIYAISYTGAAIPGLIAGQLSKVTDLQTITAGYAALALAACIVVLIFAPGRAASGIDRHSNLHKLVKQAYLSAS